MGNSLKLFSALFICTLLFGCVNDFSFSPTPQSSSSSTPIVTAPGSQPPSEAAVTYLSAVLTQGSGIGLPISPNSVSGGAITACASSDLSQIGLSVNSSCVISGVPAASAGLLGVNETYHISVTNAGGTSIATVSITVNDVIPSLTYANAILTKGLTTGLPISPNSVSGGAITGCASADLVTAGLVVNLVGSVCVISGTPTASASLLGSVQTFHVVASNSGGSVTAPILITINDIPPMISYASYTYTNGSPTSVSISPQTNTGGAITACASADLANVGLIVTFTSGTCVVSGVPSLSPNSPSLGLPVAYHVTATNSGGPFVAPITITVNPAAPILTYGTANTLSYHAGSTITSTPVNTGGAIAPGTCAIVANPGNPTGNGIPGSVPSPTPSIDVNTCAISWGTPLINGTWYFTVTASNAGGKYTGPLAITITDSCYIANVPLAIPYPTPPNSSWDDSNGDFVNANVAVASCYENGVSAPSKAGFEIEADPVGGELDANGFAYLTIPGTTAQFSALTVDFATYSAPNQVIITALDKSNNETTILNTCSLIASSPGIEAPNGPLKQDGRPWAFMVEHVDSSLLPSIPSSTVALKFYFTTTPSFLRVSGIDISAIPTATPTGLGATVWNPFPAPTTAPEKDALAYPVPSGTPTPCGGPGY